MASRWLELLTVIAMCALAMSGTPPTRSRQGEALQIIPKACTVNNVPGVCMFVWQCIHHQGKHLGMCMDAFMFGSCCQLPPNASVPTVASEPQIAGSEAVSAYLSSNRPYTSRPITKKPFKTSSTTTPRYPPDLNIENSVDYSPPEHIYSPQTTKYPPYSTTLKDKVSTISISKYPAPTEPAFVTRPKPSTWSSPFRPRPPDLIQGSAFGQRPIKPQTVVTKKPFKPASSPTTALTTRRSTTTSTTSTTTTSTTTTTTTTTTPRPPSAILDFLVRPTKPALQSASFISTSQTQSPSTEVATTTTNKVTVTKVPRPRIECGKPPFIPPRPEMRIVGGKTSNFGQWPWQVSVRRTSFFGFSSTHRCGGAIINENWIATAGHCVDDLLTSQIRIRVGEYDFSSSNEPFNHEERGVTKKVVHPKYNFFTYEYDLALVQLDRPLEFAPHIAPICLPATDDLLVGETATVTGWGRLSEGGTLPSILQEVSVPIVSNEKCKSMFLRAGRHEHIPEIFLCAGYESGGRDSCQGDSGGPLQVRGKDGNYFLAGIISWGIGCAENNLPGVCTRISKFVDWIMEQVTQS